MNVIERMQDEYELLYIKIDKLEKFIDKNRLYLKNEPLNLMTSQLVYMQSYLRILNKRISFGDEIFIHSQIKP